VAEGLLILAEDEPTLRHIYAAAFKAKGFTVMGVANGIEALDLLARARPRVLVLDVMMPQLDGIETCRRARTLLGPDVPILFLTATDGMEALHACVAAGGNDFMVKTEKIETIAMRVGFWASRAGHTQAVVKHDAVVERVAAAHVVTRDPGRVEPASPETVIATLRTMLARARKLARTEFGRGPAQQAILIGYHAGALAYASDADHRMRPGFWTDLQELLRASGGLNDHTFNTLLDDWATTAVSAPFLAGANAGRQDYAAYVISPDTIPISLRHLIDAA
jgi:DNA-binding response OmpR family regulator